MRTIKRCLGRLLWEIAAGEDRALAARPRHERLQGTPRANLLVGEEGKITLITIFVVMVFIILIGLVGNSGQAVVQKIELQNAADSAAYSTALWQARAMNAITTTNHLMGELTALIVIHEAFGGPTLEEDDDATQESQDANQEIKTLKNSAPIGKAPKYQPLIGMVIQPVDEQLIPELSDRLTDEGQDSHTAGATLYDARMTLKYGTAMCFKLKSLANAAGAVGDALEKTPFAAFGILIKLLADGAHIGATLMLAKTLQEWLFLEGLEFAAETFLVPKTILRDGPLFRFLSSYSDQIAAAHGATANGQSLISSPLNSVVDDTLKELQDRYRGQQIESIAIFPAAQNLKLPVEAERPPESDSAAKDGRPPSLWGESDWRGPLREMSKLIDNITDVLDPLLDTMNEVKKWTQASWDVPSGIPSFSFGTPGPKQITEIDGDEYKENKGIGYAENPSLEDLPEDVPWKAEQTSQWVRATYPYVDSFREPIREWLRKYCGYSNASTYYVNWTNRYTIVESFKLRKSDDQQQEQRDDEKDAFDKIREFRQKIRKLRVDLEQALDTKGDLDNVQPVTTAVKNISARLNELIDNDFSQEIQQALDTLGVPVQDWMQAVRTHQQQVETHANSIPRPADLDIADGDFKDLVSDVTLVSTLDNLLRVLEAITAKIDGILNAFSGPPHMYVMAETQTTGKGAETWTTNRENAEERFTILAFAYRRPANPPFFGTGRIFGNQHQHGTVATSQAMLYNAGGSRLGLQRDDDLQPDTGWDTLNWRTLVKAREWKADPSGSGGGDAWKIFYGSREANENAQVRLNWQAKLVPMSESRLKAAFSEGQIDSNIQESLQPVTESESYKLINH